MEIQIQSGFVLTLVVELKDAGQRDEWLELAQAAQFAHTTELIKVLDQDSVDDGAVTALHDRIWPSA